MSPPSVHRSEQQFLVSQESFQQSLRYPSSNQDQVLNPCGSKDTLNYPSSNKDQVLNPCGNKDTHYDLRSNQDQVNSPCGNKDILSSPCGSVPGVLAVAITYAHQHDGRRAQRTPGGPVPGADAAATTPVKDPYRIPTNPGGRQHETTPASTIIVII
ncbi:hypothetical protein ACLKA6_017756 [Drosophila palustris]